MRPPPVPYRPPTLACTTCGGRVRLAVAGWEHVRRLRHRDWHPVTLDGLAR